MGVQIPFCPLEYTPSCWTQSGKCIARRPAYGITFGTSGRRRFSTASVDVAELGDVYTLCNDYTLAAGHVQHARVT